MRQRKKNSRRKFSANKYISNPGGGRSETYRAKSKRNRALSRTLLGIGLIAAFLVLTVLNIRITSVKVIGDATSDYQTTVESHVNRNPFSDIKFSISSAKVVSDLKKTHPEIAEVSVSIPIFGGELVVEIVKRNAQLVLSTYDEQMFIVDEEGIAYDIFKVTSEEQPIILYDRTAIDYSLGDHALPSSEVSFIRQADERMKSEALFGSTVRVFYELTDRARVLTANIESEGFVIKFQLDRSPEKQLSDLERLIEYFDEKQIKPSKYIDVRVADKAYYQ